MEALEMYELALEKAHEECYAEEDEETQNEMDAIIQKFAAKTEELRASVMGPSTISVTVDMVVPDDCVAGDVVEVEIEGELMDVEIPEGLEPGDEFEITVNVDAPPPAPKKKLKPPPKAKAPAPDPAPQAAPVAGSAPDPASDISEGVPPAGDGTRSFKLFLVETDLVREKKKIDVDAKELSTIKEKIAASIFFPMENAEHLQLFSAMGNALVTTLDDLKEKDKLQVTVAPEFMPGIPKGPNPAGAAPVALEPAESVAVVAPTETASSPATHGKRNLLLILLETDIVPTNTKLKAEGVTTLDDLREMIVEKCSLPEGCTADMLEIFSTLSKADVTELAHLKDKDKIKVTVSAPAGEPEPANAYDYEAAKPFLAELFGWMGTCSAPPHSLCTRACADFLKPVL
jgi:hypothetical protein